MAFRLCGFIASYGNLLIADTAIFGYWLLAILEVRISELSWILQSKAKHPVQTDMRGPNQGVWQ
jgi:hypothetical protein